MVDVWVRRDGVKRCLVVTMVQDDTSRARLGSCFSANPDVGIDFPRPDMVPSLASHHCNISEAQLIGEDEGEIVSLSLAMSYSITNPTP